MTKKQLKELVDFLSHMITTVEHFGKLTRGELKVLLEHHEVALGEIMELRKRVEK